MLLSERVCPRACVCVCEGVLRKRGAHLATSKQIAATLQKKGDLIIRISFVEKNKCRLDKCRFKMRGVVGLFLLISKIVPPVLGVSLT